MPTVVITGAGKGLGLEFVRQYAADGWRVIATARNPSLPALSAIPGVVVRALDIGDAKAIDAFGRGLDKETVDLLVNNAGTNPAGAQSRDTLDADLWSSTARVNALGPVLLTLALAKALERAAKPKVAAVSSIFGSLQINQNGPGMGGMYAYTMTKAALNMGMRRLALDLAPQRVSVVMLHPGWVRTDMGGPNAALSPEESVSGMRKVIAELTPENTGGFFAHDGQPLPW